MQSTFTEDQVLAIWKAITVLGEAEECCKVVEHSAILAEAETLLFDVLSKLARGGGECRNVYAFPVRTGWNSKISLQRKTAHLDFAWPAMRY